MASNRRARYPFNITRCPKTAETLVYDDYTDIDRVIYQRLGRTEELKKWPRPPQRPRPKKGQVLVDDEYDNHNEERGK